MSVRLFLWHYEDGLDDQSYHDGGGVVVVGHEYEQAWRDYFPKWGDKPIPKPDREWPLVLAAWPDKIKHEVIFFPDAGCC